MRKSISFRLIVAAILLIGIIAFTESCRKADKLPVAREQVIDTYQEWLTNNGQNLAKGTIQFNLRADSYIEGQLAWENSRVYKSGTREIIVIPFSFKTASFSKTSRILPALTKGELPLMVELYLKKDITGKIEGALKISAYKENADMAMRIKYTSAYTLDMKHIIDKEVVAGKICKLTIRDMADNLQRTESDNCEEISYTYSYIKECTGGMDNTTCVFKKRTVTRYHCYGTINGGNEETIDWIDNDDGGGGGWAEYEDEQTEYANQSIIDSLQGYPCAQEILRRMPSVDGQVAKILDSTFGLSTTPSVKFRPSSNLDTTIDGQTRTENGSLVNFSVVIDINTYILNNSSQDYIAVTMIHEAIHAYINYMRRTLDSNTFKQYFPIYWANIGNDAHHNEMANNYLRTMENVVKFFNPNIASNVANALAWGGLQSSNLWKINPDTNYIKLINGYAKRPAWSDDTCIYRFQKCL